MKVSALTPDAQVLTDLGQRLRRHRLARDQTQALLAQEAGVSKSTVERLERGRSVQLESLIRVLRALDLLENLEALVPPQLPSPLATARRERASGTPPAPTPWTWGDE